MDWATIVKDYAVLITAGAGLLGIVLTFIFTRSHYLRSRKWELDDREYKRRSEIKEKRIQEAREYVEAWNVVIQVNVNLQTLIEESKQKENIKENLMSNLQLYENLPTLLHEGARKAASITILNDKVLGDLQNKLQTILDPVSFRMIEIFQRFFEEDSIEDVTEDELEKLSKALNRADKIITKMKIRLDELSLLAGKQ
jgi:hypothetical protein